MEKPKIGVPLRSDEDPDGRCYQYLFESVRRGLQKAGALIVPIAPVQDINYYPTRNADWPALTDSECADIEACLDMVDGLFIPGGYKFCEYDRYQLTRAIERDMPVLAVCMGLQIMSCHGEKDVAFAPVPDQALHCNREVKYAHRVSIAADSRLAGIVGATDIPVNSWHKRCVAENAVFRTVAWSEDGLIEAMELPQARFNIGVQWHPEALYGDDEYQTRLLDAFLDAACEYRAEQPAVHSGERGNASR